ncbi:MAG: translocation/assembly module TamB domain-containing protein [Pseudomonadota bacterium]
MRVKIVKYSRNLLVLIIVLVALLLLSLQLEISRNIYLNFLNTSLASTELNLKFGKITGFFPFNWQLKSLHIADKKGDWLVLDNLQFDCSASSLLSSHLDIKTLVIDSITAYRLPQLAVSQTTAKEPKNSSSDFDMAFSLSVENLNFKKVILAKQLLQGLSHPVDPAKQKFLNFSFAGQAILDLQVLSKIQLNIKQLDYSPSQSSQNTSTIMDDNGDIKMSLSFNPKNKQLDVQMAVDIKQAFLNQINHDLIEFPEQPSMGDIKLDLTGAAPWDNWLAKLKLSINNLASLDSDLELKYPVNNEPFKVVLSNKLLLAEKLLKFYKLPANLADISLNSSFSYFLPNQNKPIDKQLLVINSFSLSSYYAQIISSGNINLKQQSLQLTNQINIQDLSLFNDFLTVHEKILDLRGNARFSSKINGKWDVPEISYTLELTDIMAKELQLAAASSTGVIKLIKKAASKPSDTAMDIIIDTQGQFQQIEYVQLKQLPRQTINWVSQLKYSTDLTQKYNLNIQQFNLESELISADLRGYLNTRKVLGKIDFNSQLKDLSLININPDLKLEGKNTLHVEVDISHNAKNIELKINNKLQELKGLPAELMALVGDNINLQAQLSLLDQEQLQVKQFTLDSKQINLIAIAKMALSSGELEAQINSKIKDLSPLSTALEKPVSGSIEQSSIITGSLERPQLLITLKGDKLFYNNSALGQLNARLNVINALVNPEGDFDLQLKHKHQSLKLSSDFQLKEGIFYLSKFNFQAPKSLINGQMQINLQNKLAKGKLDGKIKQLSKLAFLHQQKNLSGDVAFNVQMGIQKNNKSTADQLLNYQLSSKQLRYDNVQLETLKLTGKLSGLYQALAINSELDIKKITYEQGSEQEQIGRLNIIAKGNPENIQLELKSATENKDHFFNLSSTIKQQKNTLIVLLQKLDAAIFKQPIKLLKPAQIKLQDQQIEIAPLQLNIAKAQLKLEAKLNQAKDKVNAHMQLADFPLELLSQLGLQQAELEEIQGDANINLSIKGKLSKPDIRFESRINKLALHKQKSSSAKTVKKNLPLIDIQLNANLANHLSKTNLQISGLTQQPIQSFFELPVALSLYPYKLDLEKTKKQPLKGQLNADLDLEKLSSWVELDQQLLEGQLIADIKLSGSIETPKLLGDIKLLKAKYENAQTGTLIHDINMLLNADNQTVDIVKFTANDSQTGTIKGNGKVFLAPSSKQDYQFNLDLDKVKLLRHDDMNLQLSGFLKLAGDKYKGKLSSKINVDYGEFFLPESTGADIPQLEVVEINHPDVIDEPQQQTAKTSAYPLELDIAIIIPSKMYVRGRGIESEWEGKVLIKQQLSDPLLEAHLEIKRGYFNFIRHRFNFRKGAINFVGSIPPQPHLDFEMAAKGKDITAILKITGEAENPDIKLESEPMMPDDEILARLLFNKDISEISGFEALQLASAVRTLATGGSGAMDKARGAIGVDTLDFNGDEGTGGSVKVGKHISEDVYVEVESGMTSGDSQVRVEMEMSDHISIESRVDQESNTGFGVNWKFDY